METYKHLTVSRDGFHARIAVYLAKIYRDAESAIEVRNEERRANEKEVFSVMNLYTNQGDELEFLVDGSDEEEILEQIAAFCEEYLQHLNCKAGMSPPLPILQRAFERDEKYEILLFRTHIGSNDLA